MLTSIGESNLKIYVEFSALSSKLTFAKGVVSCMDTRQKALKTFSF